MRLKKTFAPLRFCAVALLLFACTLHQTRSVTERAPSESITATTSAPTVSAAAATSDQSAVVMGATAGSNNPPPEFVITPPAPPEFTDTILSSDVPPIILPPADTPETIAPILLPTDVGETFVPPAATGVSEVAGAQGSSLSATVPSDADMSILTDMASTRAVREGATETQSPLVETMAAATTDVSLPTLNFPSPTVAVAQPTVTPAAVFPTAVPSTPLPTLTPSPEGTQPLFTLTPALDAGAPPADERGDAPLSVTTGWTCDDFPCEDDLNGWLQRIQVPAGYHVEHVGRFPGQPLQITYGRDGRLYATVLENGTRNGAVYVMDAEGAVSRYSGDLISPLGLAFQPGTDVLYVSARMTLEKGGGIWRVPPGGGDPEPVIQDLPCCFNVISNQPNGMIFGQDGYLYVGVGSLSDATINPPRSAKAYADVQPNEASILRIQPHTGEIEVYARGIRNPYDIAVDSSGQLYASDNGLTTGQGDRLLKVDEGAHYGWPYWHALGCENCPLDYMGTKVSPDLLDFPVYTRPHGLVAYTGTQFPANMFDSLFVTLWNGVEGGQRVIRVEPNRVGEAGYTPEAFVTGLIRPIDVTQAPDGTLVVVDYVYGQVWRVVYDG